RLELARRVHRLPAAQDRSRRQAAVDPDDPRRRLRAARAMSFRTRLALVAAAAVALAVVAASVAVYFVVQDQLYGAVDNNLRRSAQFLGNVPPPEIGRVTDPRFKLTGGTTQVVGANGSTLPSPSILPVTDDVLAVARHKRATMFFDAHALGDHIRVMA